MLKINNGKKKCYDNLSVKTCQKRRFLHLSERAERGIKEIPILDKKQPDRASRQCQGDSLISLSMRGYVIPKYGAPISGLAAFDVHCALDL